MNFKFVTIEVKDLEASLDFYTDIIKLKQQRRFEPREGVEIAFLEDEEGNQLELIENHFIKEELDDRSSKVQINFDIENIEDTIKFINKQGLKLKDGPVEIPNGRFITLEDPDGVRIGLFESE